MDVVLLALVLVLIAGATHVFQKRRKWSQAVELLPGPPAVPILGNSWDLVWKYNFNLIVALKEWTKTYGGVFRVWIGTSTVNVFLSNPEDVEILLSSNKHITKSWKYNLVYAWIGEGLLSSGGQKWHTRRKLITPTFHFKILDQFVEVFNRNSDILVNRLLQTKEVMNVQDFISLCTLDIICETAMGTKVNAQDDATSPYVTAVNDALLSFHERSLKPWLHPDVVFNMTPSGKVFNKSVNVLRQYTQDVIKSRRREREACRKDSPSTEHDDMGIKERVAFLDQLLSAEDTTGSRLLDSDIQEEVDTFMFEGHDTTAAALSFVMYNIAAHTEVQDKLTEEMTSIFGDSKRPATSQDFQDMKYTERVIKETLRLYPSVPSFSRNIKEDLPITGGHVIPAGCSVSVNCYDLSRNPIHWPEPEKFDPDRFLPDNSARRHPYAYVPFSAGPRNCIGQKFAMMEMKSTVSKIVRNCTLNLPHPGYNPVVKAQGVLKAPNGVFLKVSPR